MTAEDNPLVSAIRNLEGKITVAKDKAEFHRARLRVFDAEVAKYETAVEAICEVIGLPRGSVSPPPSAPLSDTVLQEEGLLPADDDDGEEEAPAEPAQPFQPAAQYPPASNGFDRNVIRRELHARNMQYPVALSNRKQAHFIRQSLITACTKHPDYYTYVSAGGFDLLHTSKRKHHLDHAVETLGIDRQRVSDDARMLYTLIYNEGIHGVDYR